LLKPREKPSEKPSEKLVRNQVGRLVRSLVKSLIPSLSQNQSVSIMSFVERMVIRKIFAIRERREARKDRYHTSHGVPESRMPLLRSKVVVKSIPAWGTKSGSGGRDLAGRDKPVRPICNPVRPVCGARTERPVRPVLELVSLVPEPVRLVGRQQGDQFAFRAHGDGRFSSFGHDVGGRCVCLVVLSLLDVLLLVVDTSLGEVAALGLRKATDHDLSFVVLVLVQRDRSGFPMVVPGWIGTVGWMLLTLLLWRWLGTGLKLLVLTLVLSRLLAFALGFELQVGGSENMWLISGVVLWPHISVVSKR
jgi:hypothetical protein